MGNGTFKAKLTTVVASIITFAWTVSYAMDIFIKTYDPHPSITPLMLAVATYLFGGGLLKSHKNGAGNG